MIFDEVLSKFIGAMLAGFPIMGATGLTIFALAAGLSWAHTASKSIGATAGDVLANCVHALVYLVLYWLLLTHLRDWATGLWEFGLDLGGSVGGIAAGTLRSPSRIFAAGHASLNPILTYLERQSGFAGLMNLGIVFNYGVAYLVGVLAFACVTLQVCLTLLAFYLALLCSPVLIAWAPLAGASFVAEMSLGWLVATIIRGFIQVVIVGIATPLFGSLVLATSAGHDPLWWESLGLVLGSVLYALIAWILPNETTRLLVGRGASMGLGGEAFVRGLMSGARGIAGTVAAGSQVVAGVSSWMKAARSS